MVDWRVTVTGQAPSTQDPVRIAAEGGEPEGFAVQALAQTGGRGRHGNQWVSPMGNLYISLLLRPACKADEAGQIAFIVALALSRAMDEFIDAAHIKTLKWPNDILIDGKKVSGILLESSIENGRCEYLIAGVGVNILAAPEGGIGLDAVKCNAVPIHPFRDRFLAHLSDYMDEWRSRGFSALRDEWLAQAHGLNEPMSIRLPEVTYEGIFRGIDTAGGLLAEIGGEIKRFTSGDVHFTH